jgi:predicted nucleic acid-binding protein
MYVSAITIGEIARGIESHRDAVQRQNLQTWLDEFLRPWLERRILPISEEIAEISGRIAGKRDLAGKPIHIADALLAATAQDRRFTLVTRNVRDFELLAIHVMNPWQFEAR